MKVAFLTNDLQLSGGVGVVVSHARELAVRHGFETTLVLTREQELPHWEHQHLQGVELLTLTEARERRFDVAVATWWETALSLFELGAERYAYFVQSLEDRFYGPDEAERLVVPLTWTLPVAFITEASWIVDTLADLRPDAACHLVRNGIDKEAFAPIEAIERNDDGPLRILVEGYPDVWFKGVNQAIAAVRAMMEPHTLTVVAPNRNGLDARGAARVIGPITHREMAQVYGETDVVLKLSSVEGMFGPPLEGFHRGATCVTTEVTGHDEYIEHGRNALVCDWDDERGTARLLDLLARDRRLLHELRANALQTARRWPSWEQAGAAMAHALRAIADAPPPGPYAHGAAITRELQTNLEVQRLWSQERRELAWKVHRYERLERAPGISHLLALRSRRSGRLLLRLARPITRRAKARLLGA